MFGTNTKPDTEEQVQQLQKQLSSLLTLPAVREATAKEEAVAAARRSALIDELTELEYEHETRTAAYAQDLKKSHETVDAALAAHRQAQGDHQEIQASQMSASFAFDRASLRLKTELNGLGEAELERAIESLSLEKQNALTAARCARNAT